MKKIANWTIGSFFRTVGRVIAYTLFGLLLGYLLNKLPIKKILPEILSLSVVKADTTGTYTSASYEVKQCYQSCNVSGTNCYMTNCVNDSKNINQSMSFGSSNGHINRYQFLLYNNTSSGWDVGSWDVTFAVWRRPNSNAQSLLYNYRFYANDRATSSGAVSGSDTNFISNYVCQQWVENEDWFIRCKFYNKVPIKFIMVELELPNGENWVSGSSGTGVDNLSGLMLWGIQNFTGSTDATGAINNQTTVIQNEFNQVNENISDLKDSLTDESAPDTSALADSAGWLPPGPVDSILNLPLTLLNSLNTALSSRCVSITIPLPYINRELPIACITTIYENMGVTNFLNWVGRIASAFILFKYLISLYKWVDDTLTFRENHYIDNWGGVD